MQADWCASRAESEELAAAPLLHADCSHADADAHRVQAERLPRLPCSRLCQVCRPQSMTLGGLCCSRWKNMGMASGFKKADEAPALFDSQIFCNPQKHCQTLCQGKGSDAHGPAQTISVFCSCDRHARWTSGICRAVPKDKNSACVKDDFSCTPLDEHSDAEASSELAAGLPACHLGTSMLLDSQMSTYQASKDTRFLRSLTLLSLLRGSKSMMHNQRSP